MHTNSKMGQRKNQNPPRRHSVAEPQPKAKIHHGGTETRRRSKPILTTEDTTQQSHNQNHSLPQRTRRNTKRTKTDFHHREDTEGHGGELETKSLQQRQGFNQNLFVADLH